uniref:Reverse transcriptase domain-containing protein n=1 Tax=Tanacetum cinerariifolium TaxID=118510 RepID=A0A6L2LBR1_TANCI|nr:hypothetical protein [Tanacetum cinerariifolium]
MVDSYPMEEEFQGAITRDVRTETYEGPTELVLQTQKTPSPSSAFIKENINALRTMINKHDQQAKMKATLRKLAYADFDKDASAQPGKRQEKKGQSLGEKGLGIESDEFIKSSVENLVPNPSESEDLSDIESECDVPVCDNFTTFSNSLFDADDNFSSSDDESFFDEDVPNEIYSNPVFDEEIISIKIDPHHFNAESDLIESLLNQDYLIISSPKIDSLLVEFFDKLAHIDLISLGINEVDFDPKEEIRLVEKFLYVNSSPRPSKEPNSKIFDAVIESFSPSPIPIEGSDSLMEEIDIFLLRMTRYHRVLRMMNMTLKGISFSLKNFLAMIPLQLLCTQPTLASNEEKSPHLLSHRGFKAF